MITGSPNPVIFFAIFDKIDGRGWFASRFIQSNLAEGELDMKELMGKNIAIAANRRSEEIAEIIRKKGGEPVVKSIQGQMLLNEKDAEQDVEYLLNHSFDWIVLTTGVGAQALENAAKRLDVLAAFIDKLSTSKLAIRGSKATKWLRTHGLEPTFLAPDATMHALTKGLQEIDIAGDSVFFQAYNKEEEKSIQQFVGTFSENLYMSRPYHYLEPDKTVLQELVDLITSRSLDAVIFTTKTQVRNLLANQESKIELVEALQADVLAVSVGKVTTQELLDSGVQHVIEPQNQKMGAMIVKLANYYREQVEK